MIEGSLSVTLLDLVWVVIISHWGLIWEVGDCEVESNFELSDIFPRLWVSWNQTENMRKFTIRRRYMETVNLQIWRRWLLIWTQWSISSTEGSLRVDFWKCEIWHCHTAILPYCHTATDLPYPLANTKCLIVKPWCPCPSCWRHANVKSTLLLHVCHYVWLMGDAWPP